MIPNSFGDDARTMTVDQLQRKYRIDTHTIHVWRERICAWNERSYDLKNAEMCLSCTRAKCGGWCKAVTKRRRRHGKNNRNAHE